MSATSTTVRLDEEQVDVSKFDYDFIYDAIRWARRDEEFLASLSENDKVRWGQWDQGSWGYIKVENAEDDYDLSSLPGMNLPSFSRTLEFLTPEAAAKAIRSGHCKTAYCMAGQRVNQEPDVRMLFTKDSEDEVSAHYVVEQRPETDEQGNPTGRRGRFNQIVMEDVPGTVMSVSEKAADLMGITNYEANAFFESDNSVEYLMELANGMCQRRGIPLMFPDADVYESFGHGDEDY